MTRARRWCGIQARSVTRWPCKRMQRGGASRFVMDCSAARTACLWQPRTRTSCTARHIRGDLHLHSTWSDGRDSIQHMVLAAKQIGYEYVAITDHSERAFASRKL